MLAVLELRRRGVNMGAFGDELKRRRLAARLSLDALADLSDLSKTYIANIENDKPHNVTGKKPTPSREVVDSLAMALDWPLSDARPLAGYAYQYHADAKDSQIPPELENIYAMHGRVLRELPPGPARERYLAKLRATAEADLAMIEVRLNQDQR